MSNDRLLSDANDNAPKRIGRRRFLTLTGGALVASGLLAACGDNTPTSATTTTAAAGATTAATSATTAASSSVTTAAAAAGPTLKIGLLLPTTGVYGPPGLKIIDGWNFYLDSISNTIAGRKVEVIKEDEGSTPDNALVKARKLIEQDKVDILAGIYTSTTALAVRDYLDQTKTITVIVNAGARDITGAKFSKYIFRTSFTNGQISYPFGDWAYKNVGKKGVLVAPDYAAGHENTDGFKATFVKAGGTVLKELYPGLGKVSDFAPFMSQIQDAKPDFTYAFFSGTDAVNFIKQYEQFGLKKTIPLIGWGVIDESQYDVFGTSVLDLKSVNNYTLQIDSPENKQWISGFQAKYNRIPLVELEGFDAARFIAEGVKATNGDTSNKDNLIKAMEGVKFTSPRGPVSFDASTHGITQNMYVITATAGADGKPVAKLIETFPNIPDINVLLK